MAAGAITLADATEECGRDHGIRPSSVFLRVLKGYSTLREGIRAFVMGCKPQALSGSPIFAERFLREFS